MLRVCLAFTVADAQQRFPAIEFFSKGDRSEAAVQFINSFRGKRLWALEWVGGAIQGKAQPSAEAIAVASAATVPIEFHGRGFPWEEHQQKQHV